MDTLPHVSHNALAQLVPLNALLPDDLKHLAAQTRLEQLPSGKTFSFNGMTHKFYLLKGKIQLLAGMQVVETLEGGSNSARYAVNRQGKEALKVRTASDIVFVRINMGLVKADTPKKVEKLHATAQQAARPQNKKNLWMDRLMGSVIFRKLSPSHIRRVIERLEDIAQAKGDVVIRQGEKGTSFFVVKKGQATVVRKAGQNLQKIALLYPGDTFGAISLLADVPHEISVIMNCPGEVLRLDKDDFFSWIVEALNLSVGYRQAEQLREKGAHWLDARTAQEYQQEHLSDSLNLPLLNLHLPFAALREKNKNIPEKTTFLVYSNNEKRANAAAYRLLEQGISAHVLRGGLRELPERIKKQQFSGTKHSHQAEEALQLAKQQARAQAHAAAEMQARREIEQRAKTEAAALLEQVKADARRLEIEKRRQQEATQRLRQEQEAQLEAEKLRFEEERRKTRQKMNEQFKNQIQEQLAYLKNATNLEREERQRLEDKLTQELERLNREKGEQQEHWELDRQRAEEENRLLQIQLKAARAVQERKQEMEEILAKEAPRPAKRGMLLSIGLTAVFLAGALGVALNIEQISDWFAHAKPQGAENPAPPDAPPAEPATPTATASPVPKLLPVKPLGTDRDPVAKNVAGPKMVKLPGGTFLMGSAPSLPYNDEHPQHAVTLAAFSISMYEISFAEYDYFARQTGKALPKDEAWGRERQPVINVSWNDAVDYTRWLSEKTGRQYRLPSEREWEYAALAGAQTAFWWGPDLTPNQANCMDCGSQWDSRQPAPIDSFQGNPALLYNVAGNVSEWVYECLHPTYAGSPAQGQTWDGGSCGKRMVRGGSFRTYSRDLRLTKRTAFNPKASSNEIGFRVVRVD